MKIRSLDQLDSFLDEELSWRKKELTTLMNNFISSNEKQKDHYLRVAIFLIYSHWEGFIKRAAEAYLEYISNQKIKFNLLNSNFLALALEDHLDNSFSTSIYHKKNIVDFVLNELGNHHFTYKKGQISAQNNLKFEVLEKICTILGVDGTAMDIDIVWLDDRLLKYRNEVAHGERLIKERIPFELVDLKSKIQNSLDIFKNIVSNAACQKSYLKQQVI